MTTHLVDRIYADLATRIETGALQAGDRIPTAQQLATTYGCSLTPVHSALNQLKTDAYVAGHRGRGTYVLELPVSAG